MDLKETKDLYERLMVLTRSNFYIDEKQTVGTYEFTPLPRALFAPDGLMLPCSDKSMLIYVRDKLRKTEAPRQSGAEATEATEIYADSRDHSGFNCSRWDGPCPETGKETSNCRDSEGSQYLFQ